MRRGPPMCTTLAHDMGVGYDQPIGMPDCARTGPTFPTAHLDKAAQHAGADVSQVVAEVCQNGGHDVTCFTFGPR